MKITNKLSRLSLNDAGLKKVTRTKGSIEIVFDWAKLENFAEKDIAGTIILGQTTMKIDGVANEKFTAYTENEERSELGVPSDLEKCWEIVSESEIDDKKRTVLLSGMVLLNNQWAWAEWSMNYEQCEVEWTSYCSLEEWKNGKMP